VAVRTVGSSSFRAVRVERSLTELVRQGWRIVTAGGGGNLAWGSVILQRGEEERYRDWTRGTGSALGRSTPASRSGTATAPSPRVGEREVAEGCGEGLSPSSQTPNRPLGALFLTRSRCTVKESTRNESNGCGPA
jgi:hypothetical protein